MKLEEGRKKRKELLKKQRLAAEYHSINVAAIVLYGEPKLDEPLIYAWRRTLEHHKISIPNYAEWSGQSAAANSLSCRIRGDRDCKTCFTETFENAPTWLLRFTRICLDSFLLDFELPLPWGAPEWRTRSFQDARRWPALPQGMMSDGGPIPELDVRQIEVGLLGAAERLRSQAGRRFYPWTRNLRPNEDPYGHLVRR